MHEHACKANAKDNNEEEIFSEYGVVLHVPHCLDTFLAPTAATAVQQSASGTPGHAARQVPVSIVSDSVVSHTGHQVCSKHVVLPFR